MDDMDDKKNNILKRDWTISGLEKWHECELLFDKFCDKMGLTYLDGRPDLLGRYEHAAQIIRYGSSGFGAAADYDAVSEYYNRMTQYCNFVKTKLNEYKAQGKLKK